MHKYFILLLVMLSFLWTGCSAVHQKNTTTLSSSTRMSDEACKLYVAKIPDAFVDKKDVLEKHIVSALRSGVQEQLTKMSRIDFGKDWYIFTSAGVEWTGEKQLTIQVKRSLRKNGAEVEWLQRTYTADISVKHDDKNKQYEVGVQQNPVVSEASSAGFYSYVPEERYVPSYRNLSNVTPTPWGKHDMSVMLSLRNIVQDMMDANANAIYYLKTSHVKFCQTVTGDPQDIREEFASYMAEEKSNAVVLPQGVLYEGKMLVQLVDTIEGVTFMWDIELPEEVGLYETRCKTALGEWATLALTKRYVQDQ
ncbi:hypothetical protein [Halodesulfovibrio sp.]|uniref:hypothetical protein n=1 Tax=Halodesulfovibrio sp. TaxID=1912772 RepID=UPI0025B7D5F7|nr:hypothetical protein [Halodesulfovibrio sp.]